MIGFWQLAALALVVTTGELLAGAGESSVVVVAAFVLALASSSTRSPRWPGSTARRSGPGQPRPAAATPRAPDFRARHRPPRAGGELVLDGIGFGYVSGRPVQHDVSLRPAAGDHVALVDPTGAGKSTVAKLAAGLLAPDPGRITLGGVDLSDVTRWNCVVGSCCCTRMVTCWPRTCTWSRGTTGNELIAAVGAAGLDGWLTRPRRAATVLHSRGGNLSASERQLVALAWAALADPAVLILHEATAGHGRPLPGGGPHRRRPYHHRSAQDEPGSGVSTFLAAWAERLLDGGRRTGGRDWRRTGTGSRRAQPSSDVLD